ncbi:hypothetical protein L7F22_020155 [Adiantum nelumboides]|nr:hypothetical protein [Adiantum nelumboides]
MGLVGITYLGRIVRVLQDGAFDTIGTSGQASSFLGAPLATVASSPIGFIVAKPWGLVAVSAGMFCLSRYVSDLGNRRDVTKVVEEDLTSRVFPAPTAPLGVDHAEKKVQ